MEINADLQDHQKYLGALILPHPTQHGVWSIQIFSHLVAVNWCTVNAMLLMNISLMKSKVEHLFVYLLGIPLWQVCSHDFYLCSRSLSFPPLLCVLSDVLSL